MRLFKRFLLVALFVGIGSIAKAADQVVTSTIKNSGGAFGGTYVFLFSNFSDGTGESAVVKVSTAALSGTPTRLKITKLRWSTNGMNVAILFDGTTDSTATILSGQGYMEESEDGVMMDPWVSGHTGNILFTTQGHTSGDGYTILLEAKAVQ